MMMHSGKQTAISMSIAPRRPARDLECVCLCNMMFRVQDVGVGKLKWTIAPMGGRTRIWEVL
ncbi:MAG: hypothetical protein L0Z07_00085 [Planctomycetes bacterium]|nr:hypothetical protein [Planctomycetota bacterium]